MKSLASAVLFSMFMPGLAAGQGGGFVPGSRELFSVNFAAEPLGEFPKSLRLRQGTMDMVEFDGQRMLKASDRSMFLVRLPEVMPEDFTLEFDLVPKECCSPEDLAFEGTLEINQGESSAHVLWKRETLTIIGGAVNNNIEVPMPPDLATTLPGELTQIRVSVQGTTIKLFTNGREVLSKTGRSFARTRTLRVFLGGQDDKEQAVYLAKLRVATNSPPPPKP
jgi:hypothetical protein